MGCHPWSCSCLFITAPPPENDQQDQASTHCRKHTQYQGPGLFVPATGILCVILAQRLDQIRLVREEIRQDLLNVHPCPFPCLPVYGRGFRSVPPRCRSLPGEDPAASGSPAHPRSCFWSAPRVCGPLPGAACRLSSMAFLTSSMSNPSVSATSSRCLQQFPVIGNAFDPPGPADAGSYSVLPRYFPQEAV
jgi:hypothetical protein